MTTELINYDDRKTIDILKNTVAQGLSDSEFMLFSQYCKSSGLNAFKKEVWAIKAGGRLQIMTGINGFWAIANKHPMFDGYEEDIDVDEKGNIIKAWCKVYRKDRKYPSVGVAMFKECKGQSPVWISRPSQMILKCAESFALRKAFPQELNGLYTEEEMPAEYAKDAIEARVEPKKALKPKTFEKRRTYYGIPDISSAQAQFFAENNCEYNESLGVWDCPVNFGPKLAKYEVSPDEVLPYTEPTGTQDDAAQEAMGDDDIPMGEVVDAPKMTKVQELQARLAAKGQTSTVTKGE